MGLLGTHLQWDCNMMGDHVKISPHVPSTCMQKAIHLIVIIHIFWSHQIYVDIDNPLCITSIFCDTTSSYLWNYVGAASDVSYGENLQCTGCQCCSHLNEFRDRIKVSRVFRYCGERQGNTELNKSLIMMKVLDFE